MEYTALIHKNYRNKIYVANCLMSNVIGYGKTEEDALKNLKDSLQISTNTFDINIRPLYKLSLPF